jgi:hypothetical protein
MGIVVCPYLALSPDRGLFWGIMKRDKRRAAHDRIPASDVIAVILSLLNGILLLVIVKSLFRFLTIVRDIHL